MFGQLFFKKGCNIAKRYCATFMCLRTSAVHIVITKIMTTETFFMRLFTRRENIVVILGYHGINTDGARTELKRVFSKTDKKKMNNFLAELGEK